MEEYWMKKIILFVGSLLAVFLMLMTPNVSAVENTLVENTYEQKWFWPVLNAIIDLLKSILDILIKLASSLVVITISTSGLPFTLCFVLFASNFLAKQGITETIIKSSRLIPSFST